MCTYLVDEADGKILAQTDKTFQFLSYGICCSANPAFIYVTDFTNSKIRKFNDQFKEVGQLQTDPKKSAPLSGPCQINVNEFLGQIHVVDQNNFRVVVFDLKTGEYHSEFKLFEEDVVNLTKPAKNSYRMDLTAKLKGYDHVEDKEVRAKIDFKPFGIYSKLERIYITDWNRGLLYMYKSGQNDIYKLERKIQSLFTRPRDVMLDSLDSMLVVDMDKDIFVFLDNKGSYLFETPVPKKSKVGGFLEEKGVFGLVKLENKLIFTSNSTIYICQLSAIIEN